MAKRKKAAKKKAAKKRTRPSLPKKVTIMTSKKTTIGKARKKTATQYMKQAKDLLYNEMAGLMVRKEKATKKSAKKKIAKQITAKRQQINRLK
jgi:hypothetical protein